MKKRNKHFENKFKKVENCSDFFAYAYTVGVKSSVDLSLTRELSLNKLKKLHIPSAFQLEKIHKAQGPQIIIIYGQNLNYAKLHYIEKLKVLGLKINNLIYSHQLLQEVFLYQNTLNLCYIIQANLLNQLLNFAVLSSINSKLIQDDHITS